MAPAHVARHADGMGSEPVRVLCVDDHPAVRNGIRATLDDHPSFIAVAAAAGGTELWPRYNGTKPDLVLLDYHLADGDGLALCRRLKALVPTPRVVIYSAYADSKLAAPVILAGADALVHKGLPAAELISVLALVSAGERVLPPLTAADIRHAVARVDPADASVVRSVLEGEEPEHPDADAACERALTRLRLDAPSPVAPG
jgi:DNA-binding NarL/FixJ family response regulator